MALLNKLEQTYNSIACFEKELELIEATLLVLKAEKLREELINHTIKMEIAKVSYTNEEAERELIQLENTLDILNKSYMKAKSSLKYYNNVQNLLRLEIKWKDESMDRLNRIAEALDFDIEDLAHRESSIASYKRPKLF